MLVLTKVITQVLGWLWPARKADGTSLISSSHSSYFFPFHFPTPATYFSGGASTLTPKSHPSKPGRSRVRHLQPFQAVLLLPSTRHFWDASDSLAHLRRAVRVFSGFCSVAALTRCSRFFLYINKCVLVYFAVCEDARPVCCQSQLDRRGTFCHVKSSDEVELRGEMATVDSVEQLFCVRG